MIATEGHELTESKLIEACGRRCSRKDMRAEIAELARSGLLERRAVGRGARLRLRPEQRAAVLERVRAGLSPRARIAGSVVLGLLELVAPAAAQRAVAGSSTPAADSASRAGAARGAGLDEARVLSTLQELWRRQRHGAMVSIPELLEALGLERLDTLAPLHRAEILVSSLARTHRLGTVQCNRLRDAILAAYRASGIELSDPRTWRREPPTLHDVVARYLAEAPRQDTLYTALRQIDDHRLFAPDPAAARGVWEWVRGVVVFDLRRAAEALHNLAIACVLDLFYAEMVALAHAPVEEGARRLRAFVLVDEADNFLQQRFAVLRKLLKEGCKYGVGTILSTQFLDHFAAPRERYHQAIGTWILHWLDSVDPRALRRAFSRLGRRQLTEMTQQLGRLGPHESLALLPGPEPQPVPMRDLPFYELVASASASGAARG